MASSKSKKLPCSIWGKTAGIFMCRGCEKYFCSLHVAEHRQTLGKHMDEVTLDHDQVKQILDEHTRNPSSRLISKHVEIWEEQSIEKICKKADDIRSIGNIQIGDNRKVIVHGEPEGHAVVRGKCKYIFQQYL